MAEVSTFQSLVRSIHRINEQCELHAKRAVNVALTLRNWMIGMHIADFELRGKDRARYGDRLLDDLSSELKTLNISNTGRRQLYNYLSFYRTYPEIVRTLPAQLECQASRDLARVKKLPTASAQSAIPVDELVNKLSYSHLELLVGIEDDLKRAYYEFECVRGYWSVRELRRQIDSLYFERLGLSMNKKKLAEMVRKGAEQDAPHISVRDPYVFEFLGIKPKEVMGESALEDGLLDKLQDFLLEMGTGFCFEARQKRILIGDTHYFVDLVFYHRLLKCHVLIELKMSKFTQEDIGQLNTYVSWYKKKIMALGDNPPFGILLCARKDHALVEYALSGMNNLLFVSKYQTELPRKEDLEKFFEDQMREIGEGQGVPLAAPKNKAVKTKGRKRRLKS